MKKQLKIVKQLDLGHSGISRESMVMLEPITNNVADIAAYYMFMFPAYVKYRKWLTLKRTEAAL